MKGRFPLPGVERQLSGFFNAEAVRQASMVMHIIYKRNSQIPADRQQVFGGKYPVVIFERQAGSNGVGQFVDNFDKAG